MKGKQSRPSRKRRGRTRKLSLPHRYEFTMEGGIVEVRGTDGTRILMPESTFNALRGEP